MKTPDRRSDSQEISETIRSPRDSSKIPRFVVWNEIGLRVQKERNGHATRVPTTVLEVARAVFAEGAFPEEVAVSGEAVADADVIGAFQRRRRLAVLWSQTWADETVHVCGRHFEPTNASSGLLYLGLNCELRP